MTGAHNDCEGASGGLCKQDQDDDDDNDDEYEYECAANANRRFRDVLGLFGVRARLGRIASRSRLASERRNRRFWAVMLLLEVEKSLGSVPLLKFEVPLLVQTVELSDQFIESFG